MLLFYSFASPRSAKVPLEAVSLLRLLGYTVLSQSKRLVFLAIILYFLTSTNLISVVLVLAVFLYAILESPLPHMAFWQIIMVYLFGTIAAKFLYQFPVFCNSPAYSLYSLDKCSNEVVPEETLVSRIDYVIGVHKFSGPASASDVGTLLGILPDFIVLLTLFLHKNYLILIGVWNYAKVENNIYVSPSFRLEGENTSRREFLEDVRDENTRNYIESSSILTQIMYYLTECWLAVKGFYLKLSPIYMKKKQKNLDLRTQEDKPAIRHNFVKVKPGKSYFFEHLIVLIFLFLYYLFFYKNITGESSVNSITTMELESFSINQVFIILVIMLLMCAERTFHRQRFYLTKDSKATPSFLVKHTITIKTLIHLSLVIGVHFDYGFFVPLSTNRFMG